MSIPFPPQVLDEVRSGSFFGTKYDYVLSFSTRCRNGFIISTRNYINCIRWTVQISCKNIPNWSDAADTNQELPHMQCWTVISNPINHVSASEYSIYYISWDLPMPLAFVFFFFFCKEPVWQMKQRCPPTHTQCICSVYVWLYFCLLGFHHAGVSLLHSHRCHQHSVFVSVSFQVLGTSMSEWAVMLPCSAAPWTMTHQCHGRWTGRMWGPSTVWKVPDWSWPKWTWATTDSTAASRTRTERGATPSCSTSAVSSQAYGRQISFLIICDESLIIPEGSRVIAAVKSERERQIENERNDKNVVQWKMMQLQLNSLCKSIDKNTI